MTLDPLKRKYPVGAEWNGPLRGVDFRVWAPKRRRVDLVLEGTGDSIALEPERDGYHRGSAPQARVGARYRFRLDASDVLCPDPASRFQPEGPHGPSEVVDPRAFPWTDEAWAGVCLRDQILYELHIGTFTPEGTWTAAMTQLAELARLGVTTLQVMPIATFPGRFGWGYDGVALFAPTPQYGAPDDVRRFVDLAHGLGLGVILDVVYNHFGPDGNYLAHFSDTYFSTRHQTDWGSAINYDAEGCVGARELVTSNAACWVDEFHFDGLRLDATQNIYDDSPDPILAAIGRAVRTAGGRRGTYLLAENEPQDARLVRAAERGGLALDALLNDDFHHSARVALTGHAEAYYSDYDGTPQELVSAAKHGYLYQGQYYPWQKQRRGRPSLDLEPSRFVTFLENHDQVANTAHGRRLRDLSSRGRYRALVALLLLGPQTPSLFQGEELGSSRPFLFFADHSPDLAVLVRKGRRAFLEQFPSITGEMAEMLAAPEDPSTFARCKLDRSAEAVDTEVSDLYRDLIALRKTDGVFGTPRGRPLDGAVLSARAFVLRFFGAKEGNDRLLVVNMGVDLDLGHAPEPLLAPPEDADWSLAWSSEHPRYGGSGTPPREGEGPWRLPGEAAVVLKPKARAR